MEDPRGKASSRSFRRRACGRWALPSASSACSSAWSSAGGSPLVGAALALVFGFLWARDVDRRYEAAPRRPSADGGRAVRRGRAPALPPPPSRASATRATTSSRAPRSASARSSARSSTLPALGFAVLPAFLKQQQHEVDLGPIDDFPEGQFIVATFIRDPAQGEISRRTAFIRNNGLLNGRRASRASRTAARTSAARCSRAARVFDDKEKTVKTHERRGVADPVAARGRLHLPVPRRLVRPGGQPHRRPARPRARPLRVPDHATATSSSATSTASPR